MMDLTPAINKKMIKEKAMGAWKALTETELELKLNLTVTPLGVIAFAAGVGATVCVIRAMHKMEIKRALRNQAKTLKAEAEAMIAEAMAVEAETAEAAE